jgi:hypothetical protein
MSTCVSLLFLCFGDQSGGVFLSGFEPRRGDEFGGVLKAVFAAPVRVCRSAAFVEFVLRVLKDKAYVKVRVLVFDEQVLFAVAQFKQSLCLDDDAVGQDEVGCVNMVARGDDVLYLPLLIDLCDALCLDLRGDVIL